MPMLYVTLKRTSTRRSALKKGSNLQCYHEPDEEPKVLSAPNEIRTSTPVCEDVQRDNPDDEQQGLADVQTAHACEDYRVFLVLK
jgi:hypothetical protein